MKYDFILLENLYSVENHYKDLKILAVLLQEAGYRVAIADVFKEADLCQIDGIPHINVNIHCPKEFRTIEKYSKKRSRWTNLYYRILKDIYLYRVVKKLKGMAPNIYLGSLTMATPSLFFKSFDKHTNYYMWALRSATVLYWKNNRKGLYHFVSKSLFNIIKKHQNLKLIVSNEIIRKEFVEYVGVKDDRLILRPERYITKKCPIKKSEGEDRLNILYIGTIRPSKNIEFCLDAINKLNDNRVIYTIAGRSRADEQYGAKINRMASLLPNVNRLDRFIPDEEYERLICDCDFVVLCDKKEPSCASNGTMSEALLHGKPIIAPDINPFKNEVEKYGIGYLYQHEKVDSLCEILRKILIKGCDITEESLLAYQENFLLQNVVSNLKLQIDIIKHESY